MDRVRASLRGDRRTRTAGRTNARCAIRLFARRHLDHRRRRARRSRSGFRHSRVLLATSRFVARRTREEIGPVAGLTALVAVIGIMIVLLAVLGLVVVNA